MKTIEIGGVALRRVGTENDPGARAVVSIKVGEEWIDVLSEPLGSNFCSGINPSGILALMMKECGEADALNEILKANPTEPKRGPILQDMGPDWSHESGGSWAMGFAQPGSIGLEKIDGKWKIATVEVMRRCWV